MHHNVVEEDAADKQCWGGGSHHSIWRNKGRFRRWRYRRRWEWDRWSWQGSEVWSEFFFPGPEFFLVDLFAGPCLQPSRFNSGRGSPFQWKNFSILLNLLSHLTILLITHYFIHVHLFTFFCLFSYIFFYSRISYLNLL